MDLFPPNKTVPAKANKIHDPQRAWPAAPARDNMYYGFTDTHGARMVAQTQATWEAVGTVLEQQRRALEVQNSTIKTQEDAIQKLTKQLGETNDRLNALRDSHRGALRRLAESSPLPMRTDETGGLSIVTQPKGKQK